MYWGQHRPPRQGLARSCFLPPYQPCPVNNNQYTWNSISLIEIGNKEYQSFIFALKPQASLASFCTHKRKTVLVGLFWFLTVLCVSGSRVYCWMKVRGWSWVWHFIFLKVGQCEDIFSIFAEVGEQSSEQWAHSNYWSQFLPFPPPWPECLLRQERMICCPTAGRFAGTGGASYYIGRSGGKRGQCRVLEILNGVWFIFRI